MSIFGQGKQREVFLLDQLKNLAGGKETGLQAQMALSKNVTFLSVF